MEVKLLIFLTSALEMNELLTSCYGCPYTSTS